VLGLERRSLADDVPPVRARRAVDRRELEGARDRHLGASVQDPRRRDTQVIVFLHSYSDESLQRLVLEELPPFEVGHGLGCDGRARLTAAECRRYLHRRSLVVGAHGAAREQDRRGDERASPHACCLSGTCGAGGVGVARPGPAAPRRRPSRSTKAKLPGMRKTPKAVAMSIPQNTAVPMTFWAPAPAPLARINGTTPRMNAKAVMRIGRKRSRADSSAASSIGMPSCSCLALANSTMRIAFLAASPISMMLPIWT